MNPLVVLDELRANFPLKLSQFGHFFFFLVRYNFHDQNCLKILFQYDDLSSN